MNSNAYYNWHEIAGNHVSKFLDRSSAALSFTNHAYDLSEQCIRADAVRSHDKRPCTVYGCPCYTSTGLLFYWDRLAGYHGLVYAACSFQNDSVNRHSFTGTNPQLVARFHAFERYVNLSAVFLDKTRTLRSKTEECPDGSARLSAGLELEHLPQENKRRDYGSRFKVDGHSSARAPEGDGKDLREQRRRNAVQIRRSRSEPDEREHIGAAMDERTPESFEEWPAAPKNYGCGQQQFDAVFQAGCQIESRALPKHGKQENRQRKSRAHPKPPPHGVVFWVRFYFGKNVHRLKCHSADGAIPRTKLDDLRVHRAGVARSA
jgi:hypothetical protein